MYRVADEPFLAVVWPDGRVDFEVRRWTLNVERLCIGFATARFEADVCASCGTAELSVVDVDKVKEKGKVELRVAPEPEPIAGDDPFRSVDGGADAVSRPAKRP